MVKKGKPIMMAEIHKDFQDRDSQIVIGLLLGVLLGPIGLLIVLILKGSGKLGSTALTWALIGCLIWLAVALALFLI